MGLFSSTAFSQACSTTSRNPWEWPSHRNWLIGPPNLWNGQILNTLTNTVTVAGTGGSPAVSTYEGTSAASDDKGNLLFYTNGRRLFTGTGAATTLKFGGLLEGNEGGLSITGSAVQGIITVRHPLNPNNYFVFTTDDNIGGTLGLNYCVFDKNGNKTAGPTRLGGYRTTEGITATFHQNSVDIWITVLGSGTSNFYSYKLTCTGLNETPVVSGVAPNVPGQGTNKERGGLAFSWDSKRLAAAMPLGGGQDVSLYNFDNATGIISNRIYLTSSQIIDKPYDVIFSPDNKKIYFSQLQGNLAYYDISSGVPATMTASRTLTAITTGVTAIEISASGALYGSSGSNASGPVYQYNGSLNAGGPFTQSAIAGTISTYGLSTMFLPPQEEPDIQEVGPYCNNDDAVDLATNWLCSGLNAEDPLGTPPSVYTASCGACINAATGLFNPTTAGVGLHRIIFTKCSVDDTIWIDVTSCTIMCLDTTLKSAAPICVGNNIDLTSMLTGTSSPGTWTIQSAPVGATPATITGTTFNATPLTTIAGSYVVRHTLSPAPADPSCPKYSERTVVVNALPIVTIANQSICAGTSTTFNAGNAGSTFVWSVLGTGTLQSTNASAAGTYTVLVTNAANCSASASATLTLFAKPNVTLTNAIICAGDPAATFDAGAGYTSYAWINNGTGAARTTSGTAVGTYTVHVVDVNGCKDTASATLAVNAKPNISPPNDTICAGDAAASFDAGAGYTAYAWTGPATSASRTITSALAGTYTIIVTSGSGCKDTARAVLTVNAKPNVVLTNATICAGDAAATFDAGAGYTSYAWVDKGSGAAKTTSGTTAGTYTVHVVDANGCKDTASATLSVNTKPNVTLTNAIICAGDPAATFDAGAGYTSYAWMDNGTGAARTTSGTAAGTYTVHVVDANGCKDTASATLAVNAKPNISPPNDTICAGDAAASFDAGAGYTSYAWTGPATSSSRTISSALAGTYTIIVTSGSGCKDTASATLIVNALPTPSIAPQSICAGDAAATFDAGVYTSYLWSDKGSGALQTSSGTVAGNYICQVTDSKGCKASATGVLTVNALPTPSLAPKSICAGDAAATFDAGVYTSYLWSGNTNVTTQSASGTAAGNYICQVTDSKGCKASATGVLTVNPLPTPSIAPKSICAGDAAATFDAGVYTSYLWSDKGSGALQTVSGTAAGNYICQVTDSKGCKASATGVLTVNALPALELGPNQTICPGGTATLGSASNFANYKWLPNNENTATISVGNAGTFTLTITDGNGCKKTDAIDVTVNANLSIDLGVDKEICAGDNIVFTANYSGNGVSYAWTGTGGYTNNTKSITVTSAGTYLVHVQDPLGCQGDGDVVLKVNPLPTPTMADIAKCQGQSASFNAGNYSSYSWVGPNAFTSSSNPITATVAGTYTATVSDAKGCKAPVSAALSFNPLPQVNLGANYKDCGGTTAHFDAGNAGATYLWSNNASSQTIAVTTDGTYTVTVTDGKGCIGTGAASASFIVVPQLDLGSDIHLCEGQSKVITADVQPSSSVITWDSKEIGLSITVNSARLAIATANNGGNCSAIDTIEVFVHASPQITGIKDSTVCFLQLPNGMSIDAGPTADQYLWSDGQQGRSITITEGGKYKVSLLSQYGCAANDSVLISEDCPSSIFVANAFTPNNDDINDVFYVKGENIYDFELFVFDRWGEVIYHGTDMNEGWNGKKHNNMRDAQIDVYVWKINYRYWADKKEGHKIREQVGRVTLLK